MRCATQIKKNKIKTMAEVIEHEKMHTPHNEYVSKATANAGLTLGIIGTALGALSAFGGNLNIFGLGNKPNCNTTGGPIPMNAEEAYIEREVCKNYLDLTKQYYNGRIQEITALNDAFYKLDKQDTNNSFALYKNQRDIKDDLSGQIAALNSKVDVMAAIRPYQDALINAKIDNVSQVADFNLFKRTCRMMQGELVLPDASVTGFASYSVCNGGN